MSTARKILFVLILIGVTLLASFAGKPSCPHLVERKGVKVKCKNPRTDESINCYNKGLPPGTLVSYNCEDYYTPFESFEEVPSDQKLKCGDNSEWTGLAAFYAYNCQLECGTRRGLENDKLVIGGSSTTAERWPWHATIFVAHGKEFTYQCGGTLVNAFKAGFAVITAAHCLLDDFDVLINPNQLRVVLGGQRSDMTENKNDFNAQIFSVQKVICHEGYVGERQLHLNDVGILKLEGAVHITNTVSPACLSANNNLAARQLKIGSSGEVVGFGRYTNEGGTIVEPSPLLRQAHLPVVNNDGCYQWQKYHLDDSQICAGYLNDLSVCKGDSGGGYVFPSDVGGATRYYLQGVVSYGYVRNETFCENYGVFTKIHHYSNWIRDRMEAMYTSNYVDISEEDDRDDEIDLTESPEQNPSCPVCPEFPEIVCPEIELISSEQLKNDTKTPPPSPPPPKDISVPSHNTTAPPIDIRVPSLKPRINITNEETTRVYFPDGTNSIKELKIPSNELRRDLHTTDIIGPRPAQFNSFELGGNSLDYQVLALNLHNNYRALHGVPPLRLNEKLTKEALAYAHKLIRENTFVNEFTGGDNPPSFNKNLFQLTETGANSPMAALEVVRQAVLYWYSEMNRYNWNDPGTTTFSQVIWRSTTDFGLGVAIGHQGNTFRQVVVATYSPPGNMQGTTYFRTNVYPPRSL